MESSLLEKVKNFMRKVEENNPPPVLLEESTAGPNVKLELDLGLYDVKNPEGLKYDSIGTLIPELLDKEEEPKPPGIEEL